MRAIHNVAAAISSIASTGYDLSNNRLKIGYVTSYDPKTYTVRVRLEPESAANEANNDDGVVETGWIPIFRPYGGNKWGWVAPPNASSEPPYGDQCIVIHPDGGQGIALVGMYNKVEAAYDKYDAMGYQTSSGLSMMTPTTPEAGEMIMLHENGSYILMDGDVILQRPIGSSGKGMRIWLSGEGNLYLINSQGKSSVTLYGSGLITSRANSGNIALESSAGVNLFGGGASSGTEVITKTHLTAFANQVAAALAARQGGSSSTPSFTITGSANVKCSD